MSRCNGAAARASWLIALYLSCGCSRGAIGDACSTASGTARYLVPSGSPWLQHSVQGEIKHRPGCSRTAQWRIKRWTDWAAASGPDDLGALVIVDVRLRIYSPSPLRMGDFLPSLKKKLFLFIHFSHRFTHCILSRAPYCRKPGPHTTQSSSFNVLRNLLILASKSLAKNAATRAHSSNQYLIIVDYIFNFL